ncbi:MAG: LLM class F420-dependent oxidoreductase [Candidatus Tectimicrobiota bacterium]
MSIGCVYPNRGAMATPEQLVRFGQQAEALGFSTIWTSDHIVLPTEVRSPYPYHPSGQMPFVPTEPYLEPLVVLTYLAAVTRRIRLGTSVLILPYRNPVFMAKALATLDVLSHGRITLGVGVGWMEEEFKALGLDTYARRGAYSDECIRIFRTLWTDENPAFQGEFHQFSGLKCEPKPVQAGGIPIWVGGHTPQAIRRAARLGNGWQPIVQRPPADLPPEELRQKVAALREIAEASGRDPQSIRIALGASVQFTAEAGGGMLQGSPQQIVEGIQHYREVGVEDFRLDFPAPSPDTMLQAMERFAAEVRPQVG